MAVDGVDGTVDAETEQAVERQPVDRQPPPDQPGAEGVPSRADSRRGALAANEKPASTDLATSEPDEAASEEDEQGNVDSGEVVAAEGVITRESDESDGLEGSETPRPYAERLDVPIDEDQPTPREVLERFAPADAGLPEVTEKEAAEYIDQNADQRPWLASAKDCEPSVQRVLVAMDQGQGHALERHEGFADDEKLQRRVTALEDPAQLDDDKRVAGIDGCKPGNKKHSCGDTATSIQDPDAFATMFARGVEHPKVKEALQTPYDPDRRPRPVSIPVNELIGVDGYGYCSGYKLEPVGGSLDAARDYRSAWVKARKIPHREADVPDPLCASVSSFEAAETQFFFKSTRNEDGYEIATMYAEP